MPCQLSTDCLSEIFEYLEEDKIILHSCLFVSRLWCKISVRILWRNIWKFTYFAPHHDYQDRLKVRTAVLSTLIACLPNESMALLYKNKIFISTPTSKPPLFNYSAFCKVLSIGMIDLIINDVLKNQLSRSTLVTSKDLVSKEIITMFMNQISSLKKLVYRSSALKDYFSAGTIDCLTDLSELCCDSNIHSEFFYQLSQICHNLQSLTIRFNDKDKEVPNGLKELISLQNNLKNLSLLANNGFNWTSIVPALTKHSNTLRKLHICDINDNESLPFILSFIALLSNLQEIKFSVTEFKDFKILQNVTFPKLKVLKILLSCPKHENFIKFLENNGKYLTEFHVRNNDDYLGLSIAKFCPNLKKLSVRLSNDELDTLKTIFNSCQYLESIKIGFKDLSEKEVLEAVSKHSPENFCELKITNDSLSELFSDLELFFINWKNRVTSKSLTLISISNKYDSLTEENTKIIKKYKSLGVIKKFEIKDNFFYEEREEKSRRYWF